MSRTSRFRRFRESFPATAVALEIFSIVLAVLLALLVNEWREARRTADLVARSLQGIRHEIDANRAVLQESHAYQGKTLDIMRKALLPGGPQTDVDSLESLLQQLYTREGGMWQPARLQGAAWKTAESTGILRDMDYSLVLSLGQCYSQQEDYREVVSHFSGTLSLVDFSEPNPLTYVKGFYEGVNSLWWREANLLEDYKRALELLPSSE